MDAYLVRALVLWIGLDPMPGWRRGCVSSWLYHMPDLELDDIWIKEDAEDPRQRSDLLRFLYCAEGEGRLWIDSDIELLSPLPLGDDPMIAYERFPHHSIVWSGKNPGYWDGIYQYSDLITKIRACPISYLYPDGLYRHWATDRQGCGVPRTNLGYILENFN